MGPSKPAKAPETALSNKGSTETKAQPATSVLESAGGRPADGGGSTSAVSTEPNQQADKLATAIYIKGPGVNPETSKEQVKLVFGQYGDIKTISMHAEKGFAFIDYNSFSSCTKAIQAGKVLIKGLAV